MLINGINNIYSVGIYIRLSREDEDKTYESESITNQKSLLMQYVKENNLKVYDIYVDDGFSGTNFDRPEFKRLINDIETNKINMVITKDLSRLGRDYIGTGEFLEKYFPSHNVRYIAVTDNIDTYLDSTNNEIAPFKAIMNDYYAKDISKKIKSSLKAKMKEGKFISGRSPFGYKIDPNDKNHLVIDEEQSRIVREIFDMARNGLSYFKIAKELTNLNIKTPATYYEFKWRSNYNAKFGTWHAKTIQDILTNRVYIGDLVQNRRNKINYKVKKVIRTNPKDYIIVEGTHEPIIDKELFYEIQKRLPKNVGRNEKKENHLLDGLLYCGDCGHRISVTARRKIDNRCYTICNYYRTYMKEGLCTTHSNNYDVLESLILDKLKDLCLKYIDKDKISNKVKSDLDNIDKKGNKNIIESLVKEINIINDNLDSIYIDKLSKKISEEQFLRVKLKLETELERKKKLYSEINDKMIDKEKTNTRNKQINEYINKFLEVSNPSRELIINLIDKIEIFEDKSININLAFNPK